MSRARAEPGRARAADLQLQLAARGVPAMHRPRIPDGDRPRAGRPRSDAVDRRGRAGAVDGECVGLLRPADAGDRRALRDRPGGAVGRAAGRVPGVLPVRHQWAAPAGLLPQPVRPPPLVLDDVRGDRPEPGAALSRDRLRLGAREDRGVHDAAAVPGVQGRAVAARVARGADRRHRDPPLHGAVGAPGAHVGARARAVRARPADRAAGAARDRGAAAVPRERRRRVPVDGARRGDAVGWGGPADPPGHADRLVAGRGAVHPRRAVDRAAPARQREADRDARAAARPRQHGARGRARRGHDARGRPPRRHGPGGRRARRVCGRAGNGGRGREGAGVADRAVPRGHARDRDAQASGASRAATSRSGAPPSTT